MWVELGLNVLTDRRCGLVLGRAMMWRNAWLVVGFFHVIEQKDRISIHGKCSILRALLS